MYNVQFENSAQKWKTNEMDYNNISILDFAINSEYKTWPEK